MEHLKKQKPNLKFFYFLIPFLLYVAYAVGRLEGEMISIDNVLEKVNLALSTPWPPRITFLTLKVLIALFLIWGIGILYYIGNFRNLIPGLEYGSAHFADPLKVSERLADRDESKNKILSENVRMSIDTRKTGLNNNVTVIGGSGSGKSFHYVLPNGMMATTSMILTDPKAELYHKLGAVLEMQGYRVIALNLIDMDESDSYSSPRDAGVSGDRPEPDRHG